MFSSKLQIIRLLASLLFFISCSSSKQGSNPEFIRIGNGGGFSGLETIYTLKLNGQVEKGNELIGKLKKADLNQILRNIEVLNLDQIELNQPGNMYKFIEYNLKGKIHRMTWDSNSSEVNNNLNLFYNHLFHLIQKLNT